MLERNRFLAIKNLAKDIRDENEKFFEALSFEPLEEAIKKKDDFIDSITRDMSIAFSDGQEGEEERQIFRANILIPDDSDFFAAYSNDKNIRNLMNKYAVSIEDVMGKITELNLYGKYIDSFDDADDDSDFVDEMVNLSSKDAESLLNEIEDLSNVMDELNISDDNDLLTTEVLDDDLPLDDEEENPSDEIVESDDILDDDFENISSAVSGFVSEYSKIQEDLDESRTKIRDLESLKADYEDKIKSLTDEVASLQKSNLECANSLNLAREKQDSLNNENILLKEQMKIMEKKIKQSSVILKKIYNSIPKK